MNEAHGASHHHGHSHNSPDDDAEHGPRESEHAGVDRSALSPFAYRVLAMRELLVERGVVSPQELDAFGDAIARLSPVNGARLVARAWTDEAFRLRLLSDAQAAAAELGIDIPDEPRIIVLENRDDLHHLVVCTLCSCYPRALLGRPPDWYKSLAYRSRAVIEPRSVLAEFGLRLSADKEVRVVDSTADIRYLVLPLRPCGTEGMSEDQLVELVSRDAMIGVADARVAG